MKRPLIVYWLALFFCSSLLGCFGESAPPKGWDLTAADLLGNADYPAMSYGGYRENNRKIVPNIEAFQEDLRLLEGMGIKVIRTYNTQQFAHAANLLEAIHLLKTEDPNFEMYVMLGTWIECAGAWGSNPDHLSGNVKNNQAEVAAAVELANQYPDIVKMIAVGNEAMVQWAVNYFVYPPVILKWVQHLQDLKKLGELPEGLWITSSDNFASWGGGDPVYHSEDLAALIEAVDFLSVHTYPFHDTHYHPTFWAVPEQEEGLSEIAKIAAAMERSRDYAINQYQKVVNYVQDLGLDKPIHIGETGWSTIASSNYGPDGSHAADEYKQKLYHDLMRDWTQETNISCFYFEAFDEHWKDAGNPQGSENHFGLINLEGQVKYALWEMFDQGSFEELFRNGQALGKTYGGDANALMQEVLTPPSLKEMGRLEITSINEDRKPGQLVTETNYVLLDASFIPDSSQQFSYPSAIVKLNSWEGTCNMDLNVDGLIEVRTGTGAWWGCGLELPAGKGENLAKFRSGYLNFDIKGNTKATFQIGLQTGSFSEGTQVNHFVMFGPNQTYRITEDWIRYSIPMEALVLGAEMTDVKTLLYLLGQENFDGKTIWLNNISYSQK